MKMKQRIANLFKERQECQGIAFVIGIHGPAGTDVDIDNVCSTFNDLNFAVWRERDITCADLACLVKAAASHMYPSYKYVAFYFAGHGGSVNGHPFIVPMKLKGDGSQQILFIEQNILSCFKKSRKRCLFFFDCCLVAKSTEDSDESPQASKMFKLTAPVKCLVAYATATGYKSQGDKVQGGLWTRTLCAKLKEPLSLSVILDETHDIITSTTDEQPPHYESCLGSVNLKGNIYVKTFL